MTDPKLQILIENINPSCRYHRDDQECSRHSTMIKGNYGSYPQDAHTSCEGQILKCERSIEELLAEKPPF